MAVSLRFCPTTRQRGFAGLLVLGAIAGLAGCSGGDEKVVGNVAVDGTVSVDGSIGDIVGVDAVSDASANTDASTDAAVTDAATNDGAVTDAPVGDVAADVGGDGTVGSPCSAHTQCDSGLCTATPVGSVCVALCPDGEGDCAQGESCLKVPKNGVNVQACVPTIGWGCNPCKTSPDCFFYGREDRCISYGSAGGFCGKKCTIDTDCPSGYACTGKKTVEGFNAPFCRIIDVGGSDPAIPGVCACSAYAASQSLANKCTLTNEFGTCEGSAVCSAEGPASCGGAAAAGESCNNADDDCDGVTDEGEALCDDGQPCTIDSCAAGACKHEKTTGACDLDGSACTPDSCKSGSCVAGNATDCDDGKACTTDSCDAGTGECVATFLASGATCSDDDACSESDACADGQCKGSGKDCDDGNPCTADACDSKLGCSQLPKAGPCDDGNACTNGDTCVKALCTGGQAIDCDDGNPCTLDICDSGTGTCGHAAQDASCDDGSKCTSDDACSNGTCVGKSVSCDDGNACTTNGCDAKSGCTLELNKAPCDDKNACTDFDACSGGKCKGAVKDVADCDDKNPCTKDSCDLAVGCTSTNSDASCDDGNPCTNGDVCGDGSCTPGANLCACKNDGDCAAQNPDNLCLGTLYCDKSAPPYACKLNAATVVSCSGAGDTSCAKNLCDSKSGKCAVTSIAEGKPCDADGSVCTSGDLCKGGSCIAGVEADCNDNNPCTNDACDPKSGCTHSANSQACDADGNACTVGDICTDKVCTAGKKKSCDDSENCTVDSCDSKTGNCANDSLATEGQPCDADGTLCTTKDACTKGSCKAGDPLDCNDGNPCTDDSCDPKAGCVLAANAKPCDADGNACTVGDQCAAKVCVVGKTKACDDGDKCTTDTCDGKTGACGNAVILGCGGNCKSDADCDDGNPCTIGSCGSGGKCSYEKKDGDCNDGSACTEKDACIDGKCVGATVNCNDNNLCTDDSCDAAAGCVAVGNNKVCNDADACTVADSCANGKCAGIAKKCDDGDDCTKDSCNPGDGTCSAKPIAGCGGNCVIAGDCDDKNVCTDESCVSGKCSSAGNSNKCDDGDACTTGDACSGGKCLAKTTVCDDSNACTKDACNSKSGACDFVALPTGATCDDDSACTTSDGCGVKAGKVGCYGTAKDCNDANTCTTDSCTALTGKCANVAVASGPCDDGQPCSFGEACSNGVCKATLKSSVETIAGSVLGFADGKGADAKFNYPSDVALLSSGVVLVADVHNHMIRQVATDGTVTGFAGTGKAGLGDGKANEALLNGPAGLDVDAKGVVYFVEIGSHTLRKVDGGVVSLLAGNGVAGFVEGDAKTARFSSPYDVVARKGGALVVADHNNNRLRLVAGGTVTTLAGSAGGFVDGPAASARFNRPIGLAIDAHGNILVADMYNHRVRRLSNDGVVTTIAGSANAGWLDGDAAVSRLTYPWGVAVDGAGVVWASDRYNHRLRRVFAGKVSTSAGSAAGFVDGFAADARFNYPRGIAVDVGGVIYVADGNNHRVRRHYPEDGTPWCYISKVCVRDGIANPASPCQTCAVATSTAAWTTSKNGDGCADDNFCTTAETCTDGACKGSGKVCDDKDKCTADACDDASGGCIFKPIVGCGGNCSADKDCDDKNTCTDDACKVGKCENNANTKPCDDSDACTWGDICAGGSCVAGAATEVSTFVGGASGFADGGLADAQLQGPRALTRLADGRIWVVDGNNQRIRIIDEAKATITTISGNGSAGFADGPGKNAQFNYPSDIAPWANGAVIVADTSNQRLRIVAADGTTSTIAGGAGGYIDGPGAVARFNIPYGIAVNSAGVAYIADYNNYRIRRMTPDGYVTTVAGSTYGYANGLGAEAQFRRPIAVAVLPGGDIVIADYDNHRIRHMTADGLVSNFAGDGQAGYVEGDASSARFNHPWGIATDSAGQVYVSDRNNHRVRRIANGVVSRLASVGGGFADGDGQTVARFNSPWHLQVDADGTVLLADYSNHRIRRIKESGNVCRIGALCYGDSLANPKTACERCDVAKDSKAWSAVADGGKCQDGALCTLDDACKGGKCVAGAVRVCDDKIACTKDACDAKTGACVFDVIVGCGDYCETDAHCDDSNVCTNDACVKTKCAWVNNGAGCDDGDDCTEGDVCADGKCQVGTAVWVALVSGSGGGNADGAPDVAKFNNPNGLSRMKNGDLIVADRGNNSIRRVDGKGVASTLAGSIAGFLDGPALSARFSQPSDVAVGPQGEVAIADLSNHRVRLLANGDVSTLAGSSAGFLDGPAAQARFYNPYGVAYASGGALYVADYSNHRIRRVDVAAKTVTTIAGNGSAGWVDGLGASAVLNGPIGVAVDGAGQVYFTEYNTSRVRSVTSVGDVKTVAGDGQHGYAAGVGVKARFNRPWGIAALPMGGLIVADGSNHRLRHIASDGNVTDFAGSGVAGYINGNGSSAAFNNPRGLTVGVDGTLYIGDVSNQRVRSARATAKSCLVGGACWSGGWPDASNSCAVCDADKSKTKYTTLADGVACTDGKLCTSPDACAGGSCSAKPAVCDDKDDCTADSCDATAGACVFSKIIGCKGYCELAAHCDDKNPCTTDVCSKNLCVNGPNTDLCDDNNACTTDERCQSGKCLSSTADTIVGTLAGSTAGWIDAKGANARFSQPLGLALDVTGTIWVADQSNHRIRQVKADGTVTTIAGSGQAGFVDAKGAAAWFYYPSDVDLRSGGEMVIADRYNHRIRVIQADGTVTTAAGSSTAGAADGKGAAAQFNQPIGVATLGNVTFVADFSNQRIRRLAVDGTVTTLAGSSSGYTDAKGAAAQFQSPIGIAVDAKGIVYVTEWDGHRLRRIAADGTVTTLAGKTAGYIDGAAQTASFNRPWGVDVNAAGQIFIADSSNSRIRRLSGGVVTTLAGIGAGYVDGGFSVARIYASRGVLALANGDLLIGDTLNNRIRTVHPTASACAIDNACWADGTANPSKTCEVCNGAASPTKWDATGCGN